LRDKQKIKKYKDLLLQENQKQNLISRKQEDNIDNHIKDCLSVSSHLSSNIMDMGTGGGLPGIPLAIADPRKKIYLVEASQKKCSFLLHTKNLLGLENLHVINKRGEDLHLKDFAEDMDIVTRAFGTAEKTIKTTKKLLENPNNQLKLMKTEEVLKEEKIPKGYEVKKIEDLDSKDKYKRRILVTIGLQEDA
jgi:16S rRNA (guanine527-N7)-methyltransferase